MWEWLALPVHITLWQLILAILILQLLNIMKMIMLYLEMRKELLALSKHIN